MKQILNKVYNKEYYSDTFNTDYSESNFNIELEEYTNKLLNKINKLEFSYYDITINQLDIINPINTVIQIEKIKDYTFNLKLEYKPEIKCYSIKELKIHIMDYIGLIITIKELKQIETKLKKDYNHKFDYDSKIDMMSLFITSDIKNKLHYVKMFSNLTLWKNIDKIYNKKGN